MTTYNNLPEMEKLMILSDIERHYDWDQVYQMRVDLKDGKLCARCFQEKEVCTCGKEEETNELQ